MFTLYANQEMNPTIGYDYCTFRLNKALDKT